MKDILITTDFSEGSKAAFKSAVQLAKNGQANLHILHVVNTPVDWLKLTKAQEKNYPETIKEIGHATDSLNKLVEKAEKEGVKAKEILQFNMGLADLCHYIDHRDYDLVVIGSHGSSSMEDGLLGSNAQRILRNSHTPVLVVKPKSKIEFKKILFASNFAEEAMRAFKKALAFTQLNQAELHLLYVNVPYHFEDSDTSNSRMKKFQKAGGEWVKSTNIYNAHGEESGILNFAEKNDIDIISLTTHGKSGFMRMLAPSIAESLANHSKIPVLSTNVKE